MNRRQIKTLTLQTVRAVYGDINVGNLFVARQEKCVLKRTIVNLSIASNRLQLAPKEYKRTIDEPLVSRVVCSVAKVLVILCVFFISSCNDDHPTVRYVKHWVSSINKSLGFP